MTNILDILFNGAAMGSIYALIALGFVLIFKSTGLLNYAQGELCMVGAFICYNFSTLLPVPYLLGISGLVALSGETLAIAGDPLLKFRVANLGKSACAVPIKVQNEVIGMLVVVRKEARPFDKSEQTLLEAVTDYASISLVNARLFRALSDSANASKERQKQENALLENIRSSISEELQAAVYPIDLLLTGKPGHLTDEQWQSLQTSRAALQRLARAAEKTTPLVSIKLKKQ